MARRPYDVVDDAITKVRAKRKALESPKGHVPAVLADQWDDLRNQESKLLDERDYRVVNNG